MNKNTTHTPAPVCQPWNDTVQAAQEWHEQREPAAVCFWCGGSETHTTNTGFLECKNCHEEIKGGTP